MQLLGPEHQSWGALDGARSSACSALITELPELANHFVGGPAVSTPTLSLAQLDGAVGAFIVGTYHVRAHGGTGQTPLDVWRGGGFLPRLLETLEDLDFLLVMLSAPRRVRRDGIHFQGLRYVV